MRLITTFNKEIDARTFSITLAKDGIPNNFEKKFDPDTKEFIYYIWIIQEGTLERAKNWLELYKESPTSPQFMQAAPNTENTVPTATISARKKNFEIALHLTTSWIIILCTALFIFSIIELWTRSKGIEATTSLYKKLLFSSLNDWPGFYTLFLNKMPFISSISLYPIFSSIKQGEIWRLVSPVLLHGNFIHLFFNMLCLWVLGQQVEDRIGITRYISLTVLLAMITNTAQYLMTGPLFVGYSGILAGLISFIWTRQKVAPWEGYTLSSTAVLFSMIFIAIMLTLQIISFALYRFQINYPLNIANTAHIVGILFGFIFAKIPLFHRKIS